MLPKQLASHRGVSALEDNPLVDLTGNTPSKVATQAVMTAANSAGKVVEIATGRLNLEDTVTLSAPVHGPCDPYKDPRLVVLPGFSDAAKPIFDAVGVDGLEVTDLFIGNSAALSQTDALSAIGMRLGRVGQTPQETYKCARTTLRRLRFYGLTSGLSFQGWDSDLDELRFQFINGTAFVGEYLNACRLKLRFGENVKDFAISKSDGAELFILMEGSIAAAQASTIDECRALKGTIYLEHATNARSTPYLTIGGTTECQGLNLTISCGATMSLTAGYRPIRLDRLDATSVITVVGSAGDMHAMVDRTENCKARVIYRDTRGVWPLDNSVADGPAYNYFPNPQFDCWFRGWQDVVLSNVTAGRISALDRFAITNATNNGSGAIRLTSAGHGLLTGMRMEVRDVGGVTAANGHWTLTRVDANNVDLVGSVFAGTYTSGGVMKYGPAMIGRGQNALILKSATAQTANSIEFRLCETHDTVASPTVLALRGKRVRVGMWAFVPNLPDFAESLLSAQKAAVAMYAYNVNSGGAATSHSDTTSPDGTYPGGSYGHHTNTNSRQFIWCEMEVRVDATVIYVTPYLNQGGTMTGTLGDNFIVIQSIQMCDARVPLPQMMAGILPDAPDIDASCAGGMVTHYTDRTTFADPQQTYVDGDEIKHRTQAVGSPRGRTVTTGGAGGAVTLTAWANL